MVTVRPDIPIPRRGWHREGGCVGLARSQPHASVALDAANAAWDIQSISVQDPELHFNCRCLIETNAKSHAVILKWQALVVGEPTFQPCTPYGVMKMLEHHNIPIEGQHAVVVGRSNIAGKPMALMLINRSATVTVCTSKTRDLGSITRQADILVVATGKANMISAEMVKEGAVVIDIGINRLPDGKLAGDVHFESVKEKASYITPVPGGVGPMTITMLLSNTITAAMLLTKKN